jgi:hypothetical protein
MSEPTADDKAMADAASKVLEPIKIILAGHSPFIQGAALGQALALWLVGHPDFLRERLMMTHMKYVRSLLPGTELEIFGPSGHPSNGDSTK